MTRQTEPSHLEPNRISNYDARGKEHATQGPTMPRGFGAVSEQVVAMDQVEQARARADQAIAEARRLADMRV
eukprot:SAG31_NODE_24676_length_476_cov_1.286472_2_plen_71_part_01